MTQPFSARPPNLTRIPVFIISGFLGSGKTTLLNRLLQQYPKSAVIINEFGATPIDQHLLRAHQVPLSTLSGGCLCCHAINSLAPVLKNLRMMWETDPSVFDRVIIETSGVANPEPVLNTLLKDRWLATRYSVYNTLSTVSALMDERILTHHPAIHAQIAWADTLILTHTDLANAQQMANINTLLDRLAPAAKKWCATQGQINADTILSTPTMLRPQRNSSDQTIAHAFNSLSVSVASPTPWKHIQTVLTDTVIHHHQLIRLKGLLYTPDDNQPLLVQAAFGTLYPPTRLASRSSDNGIGQLVLIGTGNLQNVAETTVEHLLTASNEL